MAEQLIEDSDEPRELADDLTCDCLYHRKHFVPCEHIWQHELLYRVMTPAHWRDLTPLREVRL